MAGLPPGFSSSGDVALDRRYRWAKAALEAGDAAEAADILAQTVVDAPGWTPAWKLLGDARLACGDGTTARAAFERANELDPSDALGARLELARLGALPESAAIEPGYVTALFDDYADRFDAHLVGALSYRGPAVILDALRETCAAAGRPLRFGAALDLGCGTGLMGAAIRPFVAVLAGVDLAPRMVAKARARVVYDRLEIDGLLEFLRGEPAASADLVLAADVLVYLGDLSGVVAAVARALAPEGVFAFTAQALDAGEAEAAGFALGADNRFSHSADYLRRAALTAGLETAHLATAVTRQDAGRDVPGLVAVLRPARSAAAGGTAARSSPSGRRPR